MNTVSELQEQLETMSKYNNKIRKALISTRQENILLRKRLREFENIISDLKREGLLASDSDDSSE